MGGWNSRKNLYINFLMINEVSKRFRYDVLGISCWKTYNSQPVYTDEDGIMSRSMRFYLLKCLGDVDLNVRFVLFPYWVKIKRITNI